jgi:hypothetical protein
MIISHKFGFIFFKPSKVAGTSLELALSPHCGENDIVTPLANLNKALDEGEYNHSPRNLYGYYEHMTPVEIERKVGKPWETYDKVTIIRNPYDMVISRWYWMIHQYENPNDVEHLPPFWTRFMDTLSDGNLTIERVLRSILYRWIDRRKIRNYIEKDDFTTFAENFPPYWTNDNYYFDPKGGLYPNIFIRFERLQRTYEQFCNDSGIPIKRPLPRAKTKVRPKKSSPSEIYTSQARDAIDHQFERQIGEFGYGFPED